MMLETPQVMLSFEPDDPSSATVALRVRRTEREYFHGGTGDEAYRLALPRPFQETAFQDDGGWRKRPRDAGAARDLGYRMWQQLPPSLQAELRNGVGDRPLRVAIASRASGVDDIPWEWLNDGSGPEGVLAASERLRFIRLVPSLYSSPPLTVSGPIRVLTVTTNPKDERLLILSQERHVHWSDLEHNAAYEVHHLDEPGLEAFQQMVATAPPHIIHYVGHAGFAGHSGALVLHDHRHGTRWVTAAELSRSLPSSVRLLCLSTPVSAPNFQLGGLVRIAHSPADLCLPTTIANQYALEPEAAHKFWGVFYSQLPQLGGDVVEAVHRARRAVFAEPGSTWSWASFTLVVRDGTGHPLRMATSTEHVKERYAAELQAQWSARLANTLAKRAQTLAPEGQKFVASALGDEEARIDQLRDQIEKM